jgi:hypothetical protein
MSWETIAQGKVRNGVISETSPSGPLANMAILVSYDLPDPSYLLD